GPRHPGASTEAACTGSEIRSRKNLSSVQGRRAPSNSHLISRPALESGRVRVPAGYNPTETRIEGGTPEERPGRTTSGRSRRDRLWGLVRQQTTGGCDEFPDRHAHR